MGIGGLVYDDNTLRVLRQDLSDLSLLVIRERCLLLLELITDLSFFSAVQLSVGGVVYEMARFAILDLLYGGDSYRQREFLYFSIIFLFKMLPIRVGYAGPITFCVESLVNWLEESQSLVGELVGYFSHNYMLPDKELGETMKEILPKLQPYYLPVTSMERELGNMVCLIDSEDTVTEDDVLTPM